MGATIGGTPFELVEEPARSGTYQGQERRRSRPLVLVSDQLSATRRGVWRITLCRIGIAALAWLLLLGPRPVPGRPLLSLLAPLAYLAAEAIGVTLMLRRLARLAQAASRY